MARIPSDGGPCINASSNGGQHSVITGIDCHIPATVPLLISPIGWDLGAGELALPRVAAAPLPTATGSAVVTLAGLVAAYTRFGMSSR